MCAVFLFQESQCGGELGQLHIASDSLINVGLFQLFLELNFHIEYFL